MDAGDGRDAGPGAIEQAEQARAFWKALDLGQLSAQLDRGELAIEENHSKSLASRKKLAAETKGYKKISDGDEKLKRTGPLLRLYQEEIDSLTKRARFAEGAFRELYKSLYGAPDPSPCLGTLLAIAAGGAGQDALRAENAQLQRELQEYEDEFATLQNQDITIRRLEGKLEEAQKQLEARVAEATAQKQAEVAAEAEAKLHDLQVEVDAAQAESEALRLQVAEQQAAAERAQEELFELRAAQEEREAAHQAELEFVSEELGRANTQVGSLERELERARSRAALEGSNAHALRSVESQELDRRRVLELEDELIRKHEAEDRLRAEVKSAQAEAEAQQRRHEEAVARQKKSIKGLNEEIFALKVQLNERPTQEAHNKLRAQLRVMQAIDLGDASLMASEGGGDEDVDSSVLIHGRIRKLDATCSSLRVELEKSRAELEAAQAANANLENLLKDQEERERRAQLEATEGVTAAEQTSGEGLGVELMRAAAQDFAHRTMARTASVGSSSELSASGGPAASGASMLKVVQKQRNEFRQRMLELEEERDSAIGKMHEAVQDAEQLRADNVELFEKIRYLQSYQAGGEAGADLERGGQPRRGGSRSGASRSSASRAGGHGPGRAEARYRSLYEEKMNPFTDFSARERRKRYSGLNAAERLTLNATSFFLSNKYTRLFVFVYALTLHLLVFTALLFGTHGDCGTATLTRHRDHDPHQFSPQHAVLHDPGQLEARLGG